MDTLTELLDQLKKGQKVKGHFLGLVHVLIGRRVTTSDGKTVCAGLSWRNLAAWLKKVRWDPDDVRELGLQPEDLSPRDRGQYWFQAITRAKVDSEKAQQDADQVAGILTSLGYTVTSRAPDKSKNP